MTRTRFHEGLEELKQKLLEMAGMAEQAVDRVIEAYQKRDPHLCQQVLGDEPAINRAEREIDELALDLLAMQQPMAVDLRFILAVIKINADLERVGDQAVNIAERVLYMTGYPPAELPVDIPRMGSTAAGMVRRALDAFIQGDADLAQAVLEMDDVVDRMNRAAFTSLSRLMKSSPELAGPALDVLLIARNLERVADHATNIAEDVIFWIRGADVRHHGGTEEPPEEPQQG
jgi:phosphate transport system protein